MAYRDGYEDDDEADLDEREDPDASDMDEDDDPPLVPCPFCRRKISEEAEVCPGCGNFVSAAEATGRRPVWWVAGLVACGVIVLIWVLAHG